MRFEEMISLEQELSFEDTSSFFETRKIPFELNNMRTLKLIKGSGVYTNLGLVFSDQCPYSIKLAVFQDNEGTVFKDRREFKGSIIKQMDEVYEYIDFHNMTHSVIEKLYRVDSKDYPEVAVREALLNMIVHRDYSYSSSAFIRIYKDRMEFTSIGGLMPGIELEDVMLGLSVCRNENLADIFYRLELIEAYGTGIDKIMKAYNNHTSKPVITVSPNAFRISLPNMNAISDTLTLREPVLYISSEDEIIKFLNENGSITRADAESLLGISASTAVRILRRMVKEGTLIQIGQARNTVYILLTIPHKNVHIVHFLEKGYN